MEIIKSRALRGPNLWSRHTALEIELRCTPQECALKDAPGFEERLRSLCPGIAVLGGQYYHGTLTIAHALEATLLTLQATAGCPVTFSCTAPTPESGVFWVVVEYSEEAVGHAALEMAITLVNCAWQQSQQPQQSPTDAAQTSIPDDVAMLRQLREMDEDLRLGPSTGAIVAAAVARGIPFRRLTQGSLVQFGWGVKQRRIQAAEVDATSAVAESIAQDKDLTKHLLQAAGVPVPTGLPVKTADQAWEVAQRIGLPVVVKPQSGSQGRGVSVNLNSRHEIDIAFQAALSDGGVLVEKYLPGSDYRLLVVGQKLVAAARRDPPFVTGDGKHTVRELVDIVNADPRRGDGHATSLTKIRFDEIALGQLANQTLTPDTVPEKGRRILLRNNANLSTGGTATDVTDDVHPEVAARAIDAAHMIGLHVCGVDVVCESVQRPLEEQNGGIVEVNAAPGLRMHLSPSFGKGRNIGGAVMAELFPAGDDGRVPVVAVSGVNGKTTTTRLIAHLLSNTGLCVGMTNTDGVYVGDIQTDSGDCSGPKSARNVLAHPYVQAAVLETARGGVLREGLGFDRCAVAVVTNIGAGDHLGMNHIHTIEEVACVKQIIVQNVAPDGYAVLNAADPLVAAMAGQCPGKVIYFAQDAHHPLLSAHRARGNRVVFVEAGHLVTAEGRHEQRVPLSAVPLTAGGRIGFQIDNALAAVGACWALNMPWDAIQRGLAGFNNDSKNVPGRFNQMQYRGATVIADYGHNIHAMHALVEAFDSLTPPGSPTPPATHKRTVIISGAGDRRDQDLRAQTRVLGAAFDNVVLYEDACQRGRAEGEVMALLREGLNGATRTTHIEEIFGEFAAIDRGLALLQPGDQCLVLVDQVEAALAHLAKRMSE